MTDSTETDLEPADDTSLEPGKLYFMREIDLRTGQEFPYYKIGKVLKDKDVQVRQKEHQTGNPRSIETVMELESAQISRLETTMHNLFAPQRLHSGEWFQFDTVAQLDAAIKEAIRLNGEINLLSARISTAAQLASVTSNGSIKSADSTDKDIAFELLSYKAALKDVSGVMSKLRSAIKGFSSNPTFSRIAQISPAKQQPKFSSDAFKKAYSDLYNAYKIKELLSKRFSVSTAVIASGSPLDPAELEVLGGDLAKLNLEELHAEYLRLWQTQAKLNWRASDLDVLLRVATGDFEGIEGITTWKRYLTKNFDSAAVKRDHPDEYQACVSESQTRESIKVFEWKSY